MSNHTYPFDKLRANGNWAYEHNEIRFAQVLTYTTLDGESYYGLIAYRLTDWFEAGVYYAISYPDRDDRDGDVQVAVGNPNYRAWQKDLALSARFDLSESWLVKLEAHFMNGVALCNIVDNPDGFDEKDWMLFAIKTTFNF